MVAHLPSKNNKEITESLADCLTSFSYCSRCYLFAFVLLENMTLYSIKQAQGQMQVQMLIPWCDAVNLNLFLVMLENLIYFQIRLLRFDHVLIKYMNETLSDFYQEPGFGP